jgi:hypothetical protein
METRNSELGNGNSVTGGTAGGKYGSTQFGFADLELYQVARRFRNRLYHLIPALPAEEKHALAAQMRRAALSMTDNVPNSWFPVASSGFC